MTSPCASSRDPPPVRLDDEQVTVVRAFVVSCVVAWIECDSQADAIQLEDDMKREWVPPLTKR